jgi:hypothetical protein
MSINITVTCDNCNSEFPTEDSMELPPYWMGVQIAVANHDGIIVGQDLFVHICSTKCLAEFSKSQIIKDKIMFADKEKPSSKKGRGAHDDDEDDDIQFDENGNPL